MAIVWIPTLMQDLTGGMVRVEVQGRTVGGVIDALDEQYPGVKGRLYEGGGLARTLAVAVDGRISRLGLRHPVTGASEIRFLPAIEGG